MGNVESKSAKKEEGVKTFTIDKSAKVFSIEKKVAANAILLFVSKTKKVLKRSEANHGKGEIVITDKSIDINLRKGEAAILKNENDFALWISEKGVYKKLTVGKF